MKTRPPKSSHLSASKMKAALRKIESDDPELADFMKESDSSIFNFDESSASEEEGGEGLSDQSANEMDEDDDVEDDDEDLSEGESERQHVPRKLKTASDSDSDDATVADTAANSSKGNNRRKVTKLMVREWAELIREQDSLKAFDELTQAFKAALSWGEEEGVKGTELKFKVAGGDVFNAVLSACVVELAAFLGRVLALPPRKDANKLILPSASNKWKRVKAGVKSYVTDLLLLLPRMTSAEEKFCPLLKHTHQMLAYFACFPKLPKLLLKTLIAAWGAGGEEAAGLLCFASIIRLVVLLTDSLLEFALKHMYRTYVSNCKFTSVTTLPRILFMQGCLVELLGVRLPLSYHFSFIYIRQLAIHLRNAIAAQKKECIQTVYNFQFIHSLFLWTRLVCVRHTDEAIHSLIFPLTQIILGTIKLIPSAKYFPLRFHCVRALNMLSESTGVYIPVLPFLTEVLEAPELHRKPKAAGAKAVSIIYPCILKLSKAQLRDKAFQDSVIDQLYELFLEHMNIHSHSLGFPELVLPAILQLKKFIKSSREKAHGKKLKQLVDKVEEASKVLTQRRKVATLNLRDPKAVVAWEQKNKEEGNPLTTFYVGWHKLRLRQQQQQGKPEQMLGADLPKIVRPKGPTVATASERKDLSVLFESSSEEGESDGDGERFLPREKRTKKIKSIADSVDVSVPLKRKRDKDDSSDESDYSDFDDDDLAKLNRSASEEESEGESEEEEVKTKRQKKSDPADDDNDNDDDDKADDVKDFVLSDEDDD